MFEVISFTYAGKNYDVDDRAGDEECPVVLPDGTVLMISWYESKPPQLRDAIEVKSSLPAKTLEELAVLLDGVLAVESKS
jgi:hypothetical protein